MGGGKDRLTVCSFRGGGGDRFAGNTSLASPAFRKSKSRAGKGQLSK